MPDDHGTERRSRLTATGTAVAVGSIASLVFGGVTRYLEFVVLGIAGFVLLLLAYLLPRVTSAVELRRTEMPKMVQRGNLATMGLRADADGTVPPVRIVDQLAGTAVPIELPQITPRQPVEVKYRIQAVRRGVHQVGPLLEERSDPFGLVIRTTRHDVIDEMLVYPKMHRMYIATDGAMQRQRANQRPRISDDPLADFRALREYQPGDDPRLVHWASSARVGGLVVKDHFELRRAMRLVVLETLDATITATLFEEAVEIAASISANAVEDNVMAVARTRDARHPGRMEPLIDRSQVIELYTRVNRSPSASTLSASHIRPAGNIADQVFLIAGPTSPLIPAFIANPWVRSRLIVVRVSDRISDLPRLPSRTIDVRTAEDFVARWKVGSER
jgi:uncharacterized protein (DUF58 family)